MGKIANFLFGILCGALVGSAVALLMAPAPGNELRGQIQDRADNLVTDLKSAVSDERRRLEAELEALKRGELQVS